jgi:hypothetical protein
MVARTGIPGWRPRWEPGRDLRLLGAIPAWWLLGPESWQMQEAAVVALGSLAGGQLGTRSR